MREDGGRWADGGHAPPPRPAIGELYHAAYRRLVAQVYAFTTDLGEAQDVVQEAFARALARPRGLSDVDNPEAWLRTVAINVVRRRWRRRKLLDTILLRDRPLARLVQPGPEPEHTDLRNALAALPPVFREVIVLHYLADLAVDEVAATLEVPVGTVKSRLSRARAALAGQLGDYRPGHCREDGRPARSGARPGEPEAYSPPPDHADEQHHPGPRSGELTHPDRRSGVSAAHSAGTGTTEVAHA